MRGSILKRRPASAHGVRSQSAGGVGSLGLSAGRVSFGPSVHSAAIAAGRSSRRCASAGKSRPLAAEQMPHGMLAAIGESKAVREMDAQLRGVSQMRPASAVARLGSRPSSASVPGVILSKDILEGERTTYCPPGGAASASLADYTVLKKLGQGASGSVHLAERRDGSRWVLKHVELGAKYAAPSSEQQGAVARVERDAVLREVRLLAAIESPHVIHFDSSFFHQAPGASQAIVIVLEYAAGGTVADLTRALRAARGAAPEALVWQLLLQAASGLSAIHAQRVIHRDVKSANILRTADGTFKIADLGIAVATSLANVQGRVRSGRCGTLAYMAPEVSNALPYDARADVWSPPPTHSMVPAAILVKSSSTTTNPTPPHAHTGRSVACSSSSRCCATRSPRAPRATPTRAAGPPAPRSAKSRSAPRACRSRLHSFPTLHPVVLVKTGQNWHTAPWRSPWVLRAAHRPAAHRPDPARGGGTAAWLSGAARGGTAPHRVLRRAEQSRDVVLHSRLRAGAAPPRARSSPRSCPEPYAPPRSSPCGGV